MSAAPDSARKLPTRREAAVFHCKAAVLKVQRAGGNLCRPVRRHRRGRELARAPLASEISSEIWNHHSAVEFPLTAGKVQNLRVACRALDGLEIPAGATFSFWKQVGRTTRRKGYATGRELREGCLVANRGGGLCQLSNLLYNAALEAGFEIVERHAHSRMLPGSMAEEDRDATVFWNYVDLRFRARHAFRIEAGLSATHLTVRLRSRESPGDELQDLPVPPAGGTPVRSAPSGDCLTCGMTSCFRHPAATSGDRPAAGHTAFLLDEYWPEFQEWCHTHSRGEDRWLLPLDAQRWKKPNYAWAPPEENRIQFATLATLASAFRHRRLPQQGARRQRALLFRDAALAKHYARHLDPAARHLVISQNLLPHLQQLGALGGRTYDVLMTRWPLRELQRRLDEAADLHPASTTLADFRVHPDFEKAESDALAAAARLVTPHRAIAAHFGSRALLLDWHLPEPMSAAQKPTRYRHQLFFPASPLGRKGIYELVAALRRLDADLLVLGSAKEEAADPLDTVRHRRALLRDLYTSGALVLPAWIEHQPRLALRALANGIPVVASAACGLPEHPFLWQVDEPSPEALHASLAQLLNSESDWPARRAS